MATLFPEPPWEYLCQASKPSLQGFELSRLNHAARIRDKSAPCSTSGSKRTLPPCWPGGCSIRASACAAAPLLHRLATLHAISLPRRPQNSPRPLTPVRPSPYTHRRFWPSQAHPRPPTLPSHRRIQSEHPFAKRLLPRSPQPPLLGRIALVARHPRHNKPRGVPTTANRTPRALAVRLEPSHFKKSPL